MNWLFEAEGNKLICLETGSCFAIETNYDDFDEYEAKLVYCGVPSRTGEETFYSSSFVSWVFQGTFEECKDQLNRLSDRLQAIPIMHSYGTKKPPELELEPEQTNTSTEDVPF